MSIYRLRPKARCILYSQTVWGMMLSDRHYVDGSISMQGYEAIKGLSGVASHEHIERLPIVENSQDQVALSHVLENVLIENPLCTAFIFVGTDYTRGAKPLPKRGVMWRFSSFCSKCSAGQATFNDAATDT
jgi:hypothetical protein